MRLLVAAAACVALVACGGDSPRPSAQPTTPAPTTAKPKPKPKPSATASPTPTVTTPPPPSGQPLTASGAFLAFVQPGEPKRIDNAANCAAIFPDLGSPRCESIPMDAGSLLWGAGTFEGAMTVRLLTQDPSGGYVLRYEGRAGRTAWEGVDVFAAPVIGTKPDGVGVIVRLVGGTATYDVLTWVKGGPLVLRAHRGGLPDGRLGPVEGGLGEYVFQTDGAWVRRRVAWDGQRFLLSGGVRVPASAVPAR